MSVREQIERDRGGPECGCGHTLGEHRTEMFVGRMIDHAWCFTCHHVSYHEEHRITRDAAHHAFAEFAG